MSKNVIFVFGSNLAGRHGRGAALWAKQHYGAEYGKGVGLTGQAYAIPTKGHDMKVLPLAEVKKHVDYFLEFARSKRDHYFIVTAVGCGLAGHSPFEIAPMFWPTPENCYLNSRFVEALAGGGHPSHFSGRVKPGI